MNSHDVVYLFHLSYFQLAMCQNQTTCVQCLRCRSCLGGAIFAALSWSPGGRTFITPRMCGHLYLVGFPLLDDDAWQGGRCWDGAMMCHVISPEKTGNDCFPVNLWCEVFNVLTVSTDQLTGFSVLLVWPGHRAYEVHGEWRTTWFFHLSIIIMIWHVCHSIFMFACGFSWWYPVHLSLDSICRSGFFIQIPYPSASTLWVTCLLSMGWGQHEDDFFHHFGLETSSWWLSRGSRELIQVAWS